MTVETTADLAPGGGLQSAEDFGLGPTSALPGAAGSIPGAQRNASSIPPPGGSLGDGSLLPPGPVPGITATKIYFGTTYQTDQGAANAGIFGAENFDSGDGRDYYDAVIREINARGGIAGREVVPVYARLVVLSTDTIEQQFQAACDTWTKDSPHGVFAILSSGRPITMECAKKAGVAQFGELSGSVPGTFRRYPTYVEISGINMVRQGFATVGGLAGQGYFERGSRVGIVAWDEENRREAIRDGYVPALRRLGLSLATEPAYVHVPQNANDLGGTSADISAAVLRFNSETIDHVLLLDGTAGVCGLGCLTTLFLREADGQRYYPRYGFNDNNVPIEGHQGGLYPESQLERSMAVLWGDANEAADAGITVNAARERCLALMRRSGITLDNANARFAAIVACGELWFMQAVVRRAVGTLTVASFMDGVHRLGSSLNDPMAYATSFSAAKHDGGAAARNAFFDDTCSCFRYRGVPYRV